MNVRFAIYAVVFVVSLLFNASHEEYHREIMAAGLAVITIIGIYIGLSSNEAVSETAHWTNGYVGPLLWCCGMVSGLAIWVEFGTAQMLLHSMTQITALVWLSVFSND